MRFISIKARVTIYFTLMMLLVVCLVMGTILIAGRGVMSDSAEGTLLDAVHDEIDDVEYDDGYLELDDLHNGGYAVRKRMANPGALRRSGISLPLSLGRSGTVRQNDRLRQYALQDAAPYPPFFGISATGIRPNALRDLPKHLHAQGL